MAPRSKIVKVCQSCGKNFNPRNDRVKTSKFCSKICVKKPKVIKNCIVCFKKYGSPSYRHQTSSFCSKKCQNSICVKKHPLYGPRNKPWSYVIIGKRNLEDFCKICKSKSKRLDIHHIDKDKKNFHIENLCKLCRSCHFKVHFLLRKGIDNNCAINNFEHHYKNTPNSSDRCKYNLSTLS